MKCVFVLAAAFVFFTACNKNDNNNTNTINGQDASFLQNASYANHAEIDAGAIAAVKGSYDSVRVFGSLMVTDHGGAQSGLDTLASGLHVTIPSTADSAHVAMATVLQSLSGSVFDTTYIGAQVRDHMAAAALFQQELSTGNNQQLKSYANQYLPVIQMHLQEAQRIQQTLQ